MCTDKEARLELAKLLRQTCTALRKGPRQELWEAAIREERRQLAEIDRLEREIAEESTPDTATDG